jgi:4,5-DOPA dioxygenase extradiol
MRRQDFITTLLLGAAAMQVNALNTLAENLSPTETMPVLFLGHGSPMNAIEENEFVHGWRHVAQGIPRPKAIVCISAHWETKGTWVTAMEHPKTIHDFGGFPKALFDVQYPAPGSPAIAKQTAETIKQAIIGLDQTWGLDHGCWSVLKPMFPEADIPVIQISLDYSQPPAYHYQLAKEIAFLRKRGVLIIGSGNLVHNLGMVAWDKMDQPNFAYDWALQASYTLKKLITSGDHQQLASYRSLGREVSMAIPTPEHFLPMLYSLALRESNEPLNFFNDKPVLGSLTMTSFKIG